MPVRRMLPFILLNIIVSAVVVLAILFWWDGREREQQAEAALATPLPTLPPVNDTSQGGQPEASPTAPVDEADEGPDVYVVKAGETLGSISRDLGIPMEEIMAANGLTNPNLLQAGQQLILPGAEEAAAEEPAPETDEAAPAVVPTPIEAVIPTDGEAVVEIGGVENPGALLDESVSITNTGERPVALLGWRLEDEAGHAYTFGQVTLFGDGAAVLVHSRAGQESPSDLFWGLGEAVWEPGERVTLSDAEGVVVDTYIVGEE